MSRPPKRAGAHEQSRTSGAPPWHAACPPFAAPSLEGQAACGAPFPGGRGTGAACVRGPAAQPHRARSLPALPTSQHLQRLQLGSFLDAALLLLFLQHHGRPAMWAAHGVRGKQTSHLLLHHALEVPPALVFQPLQLALPLFCEPHVGALLLLEELVLLPFDRCVQPLLLNARPLRQERSSGGIGCLQRQQRKHTHAVRSGSENELPQLPSPAALTSRSACAAWGASGLHARQARRRWVSAKQASTHASKQQGVNQCAAPSTNSGSSSPPAFLRLAPPALGLAPPAHIKSSVVAHRWWHTPVHQTPPPLPPPSLLQYHHAPSKGMSSNSNPRGGPSPRNGCGSMACAACTSSCTHGRWGSAHAAAGSAKPVDRFNSRNTRPIGAAPRP